MSTTVTTVNSMLGQSNLRASSSRQTRTNPTRTSKIVGTSLRHNSMVSNTGASVQGSALEPHGFYPAITHFADAISALPRDFRRHTSLLKEADAKAWAPEENLHRLLEQCLGDQMSNAAQLTLAGASTSTLPVLEDTGTGSAANSVVGYAMPDNISQHSSQSVDPVLMQRRTLYAALRHNLMQIMITMDEKNHVINNANDELLRHIRRLDDIWPHITDEISEEARLGSLKHWAYTETNPVKRATAPTTRREAAASLAIMHESEIAHRSESRREAMMAKKQRNNNLAVDSDFDETRAVSRKGNGKKRLAEAITDPLPTIVAGTGPGKRKKPEKPGMGGVAMERSFSSALGGKPMSREPSQQESKKRKATTSAAANPARKRLNVHAHDSPKLVSSPLANTFGKEVGKQSPVLSSTRPVSSKARHGAMQASESSRARPSSAASKQHAGQAVTANSSELNQIATLTGKTTGEVKDTMKESVNNKGDRLIEEDPSTNGEVPHPIRGGLLLERTSSKQGYVRGEYSRRDEKIKATASPRLPSALIINERPGRGRASKHSTPVVESFAEAETSENSNSATTGGDMSQSTNGHGMGASNKLKRPARPRMKDHHGLHDSLSPRGLPMKRSHKKSAAGVGSISSQSGLRPPKDDSEPVLSPNSTNNLDGLTDQPEEEDDNMADDEERYCYCNGVSYGEMVACDNKDCPLKWFHLECIGLKSAPRSAKWYCEECKDNLARKGKFGSTAGIGNGNGHGGL